jgi:hypothetical protein
MLRRRIKNPRDLLQLREFSLDNIFCAAFYSQGCWHTDSNPVKFNIVQFSKMLQRQSFIQLSQFRTLSIYINISLSRTYRPYLQNRASSSFDLT